MNKIREFFKAIGKNEIVRRYVIMNSFDGALTILGIVMASFFAGIQEPRLVILPAFGAAVAMLVSGVWGAYAAEAVETKQTIKKLETHLMRKLSGTKLIRKHQKMAFVVAAVDGTSPMIVSLFILSPFFLAVTGHFSMESAYYAAFGFVGAVVFTLGSFAGKVARENRIVHGVKMLAAGVVVAAIFYVFMLAGLL